MQFLHPGQVPRRVRKRNPNAVERSPEFKALLSALRRLGPGEQAGLSFNKEDEKKLGIRWPARVTADALKRWLAETQLTDLYRIQKFKVEGRQFVSVTRRPVRGGRLPLVEASAKRA